MVCSGSEDTYTHTDYSGLTLSAQTHGGAEVMDVSLQTQAVTTTRWK